MNTATEICLCEECGAECDVLSGDGACEECERDLQEEARALDREEGWGEPDFANPGATSALRAASPGNPRNLACPTCGEPDRLTPADRARGYQCDSCADRAEGGGY